MSHEEAILFEQVWAPAFVEKCAEFGVHFPDRETLQEAFDTTALLAQMQDQTSGNVVKQAAASLKSYLGVDKVEAAQAQQAQNEKVATALSEQNPARQAMLNILVAQN